MQKIPMTVEGAAKLRQELDNLKKVEAHTGNREQAEQRPDY